MVFSAEKLPRSAAAIFRAAQARVNWLAERSGLNSPAARQLAVSADAFLVRRQSTGGKTILAGYPLFEDWGRDTMIALPGCALATWRYQEAKSILKTFMAYERDGCSGGGRPPPRHGKPAEVNAYWYNALRVMEALSPPCWDGWKPLQGHGGAHLSFLPEAVLDGG